MGLGDQFLGCSQDVLTNTPNSEFCTSENWQTAVIYLAGELQKFGLASPCTRGEGDESNASLDVIALVNSCWQLIQLYRRSQKTILEMEMMTKKSETEIERLVASADKQKDAIHLRERAAAESNEKERQALEQLQAGNIKLKLVKEESRKLMCVLLQRESKYSHEIRRTEQENTKLKERLLKVLMEKNDGRGTGNFLELDASSSGMQPLGRGKWAIHGTKDEEIIAKVMEELNHRDEIKTESIRVLRESLFLIFESLQNIIENVSIDYQPIHIPLDLDSEILIKQTRNLCDLLNRSLIGCKLATQADVQDSQISLLMEKIRLYENILQSFEANDSYDKIIHQLHSGGYLTGLEQERVNIQLEKRKIKRENDILEQSHQDLEKTKEKLLYIDLLDLHEQPPVPPLIGLPRQCVESLPSWAVGPVTVTPMSFSNQVETELGIILGNSSGNTNRNYGTSSRPCSRPGSQPGSRAPSITRETTGKQVKGKSPAASLINRRNGRPSMDGISSIGRKTRPKSANISPARSCNSPTNVPYRQKSVGPSTGIMSNDILRNNYSSYTRSLPRNQLNLKPGQSKRRSGIWSKPPTPGPSNNTSGASDNEQ